MLIIHNQPLLHAFRHFDAEHPEALADDVAYGARQCQAEAAQVGVFLAEDFIVVVELVVFFHKFVDVVGNQRRAVGAACLGYDCREVGETLDERYLFVVESNCRCVKRFADLLVGCLAEHWMRA